MQIAFLVAHWLKALPKLKTARSKPTIYMRSCRYGHTVLSNLSDLYVGIDTIVKYILTTTRLFIWCVLGIPLFRITKTEYQQQSYCHFTANYGCTIVVRQ